jgi:hypothetical protein
VSAIAVNCTEDLAEKVDSLREFGNKIFSVYSEEDMMDKVGTVRLPAVGVMYEGMSSNTEMDKTKRGLMVELRVAVVLMMSSKATSLDRKDAAAEYLDAIRGTILTTCSPTGHPWRFSEERPLGQVEGVLVYIQRWITPAPLTK